MAPPKGATLTTPTTSITKARRSNPSAKGKATAKTPGRAPKRKATDSDGEYVPAAAAVAAAASSSPAAARGKRVKRTSEAAAPPEVAVQQHRAAARSSPPASAPAAGASSSRAAASSSSPPPPPPPGQHVATPRRPSQRSYVPGRSFDAEIEEAEQALEPAPEQVEKEVDTPELIRAGRQRQEVREARRRTELAHLGDTEYRLLATIDQRGFEPFLPLSWHLDYPLKGDLYYGRDAGDTHVNSLDFGGANANFRAMRALTELVRLGPAARDAFRHGGRRPEPFIVARVKRYLDWANRDAGIDSTRAAPPIVAFAAGDCSGNGSQVEVMATLERRMHRLAAQWHQWQTNALADLVSPPRPAGRAGTDAAAAVTLTRDAHVNDSNNEPSDSDDEAQFGPRGRTHRFFQAFCNVIERMVPARPADFDDFYDSDRDSASQTPSLPSSPTAQDKGKGKEKTDELRVDAVYGIAVCHFVVAVLSYRLDNLDHGEQELEFGSGETFDAALYEQRRRARIIFYVDFARADEDFWNAVAVAMAICHCRDVMAANSEDMAKFATEQDETEDDGLDL